MLIYEIGCIKIELFPLAGSALTKINIVKSMAGRIAFSRATA